MIPPIYPQLISKTLFTLELKTKQKKGTKDQIPKTSLLDLILQDQIILFYSALLPRLSSLTQNQNIISRHLISRYLLNTLALSLLSTMNSSPSHYLNLNSSKTRIYPELTQDMKWSKEEPNKNRLRTWRISTKKNQNTIRRTRKPEEHLEQPEDYRLPRRNRRN